jgi:hypothetical protein
VEKIAIKTKERVTEEYFYRNTVEAQRRSMAERRQSKSKITKNLNEC